MLRRFPVPSALLRARPRACAETAPDERFNVRDLHDAPLVDGSLPLDLLDRPMDAWIESRTAN